MRVGRTCLLLGALAALAVAAHPPNVLHASTVGLVAASDSVVASQPHPVTLETFSLRAPVEAIDASAFGLFRAAERTPGFVVPLSYRRSPNPATRTGRLAATRFDSTAFVSRHRR